MKEQQVPGQPSNLEEGFFPVIWAQLPKMGFNIDPPSVKLFFQNRNQGGYGNPSISNLTRKATTVRVINQRTAIQNWSKTKWGMGMGQATYYYHITI